MITTKVAAIAGDGSTSYRRAFVESIRQTVPGLRVLWVAGGNDGLTVQDSAQSRPITWDGVVSTRMTAQGHGYLQTFNGTSNFGSSPDTADLTFGNGLLDQPFSVMALANITNAVALRALVAKFNGPAVQREWEMFAQTDNTFQLTLRDETAGQSIFRVSSGLIATGAIHLYAATYDGTGGATAMNGATLYVDAAVFASTATNQALYVAMADHTQPLEIGSQNSGAASWMSGSMGFVLVAAGVLSATQMLAIKAQVNGYFGLAL